MITFLIVLFCFFGLGAFIGIAYALIRYGIPTIFNGIIGIFTGAREGWIQGAKEADDIIAARAARRAGKLS